MRKPCVASPQHHHSITTASPSVTTLQGQYRITSPSGRLSRRCLTVASLILPHSPSFSLILALSLAGRQLAARRWGSARRSARSVWSASKAGAGPLCPTCSWRAQRLARASMPGSLVQTASSSSNSRALALRAQPSGGGGAAARAGPTRGAESSIGRSTARCTQ